MTVDVPPLFEGAKAHPVTFERMKQILSELSQPAAVQRLSTDLGFLKQQAGAITSALSHISGIGYMKQQACKQLFKHEPQLLSQIAVLLVAVLQQLKAQVDREAEVSRTVASLAAALGWIVPMIRVRHPHALAPPTPMDTSILHTMVETGGRV